MESIILFGFLNFFTKKILQENTCVQYEIFGYLKFKLNRQNYSTETALGNLLLQEALKSSRIEDILTSQRLCTSTINNEILIKKLKEMQPFTFIPNPGNSGDLLIAKATFDFFDKNNLDYDIFDYVVKPQKNIVFGGGGIWIPNYKKTWSERFIPILTEANKVLILPSSFYNCHELLNIINEHFIIFTRDNKSFEFIKNNSNKAEVILDHDMAFRLTKSIIEEKISFFTPEMIEAINKAYSLKNKRTVYFMRTDTESSSKLKTDLDLSKIFESTYPTREESTFSTKLMLATINRFDEIYTDRLHVAIAASLLGKRVHMIDNSYGKLSGVYTQSMSHLDHVSMEKNG